MRNVQRFLDSNDGGGLVTLIPQFSVFANGRLVTVIGSIGTAHAPCPQVPIHCAGAWAVVTGSLDVIAEGIPVVRNLDSDSCGHTRVLGSLDVYAN